ncbi:hypothetical protein P280DRAFT_136980 [Massarina eburnea CBS 473.64]|uniref:Uncharacterized protein n=1 Tax=Massarina eburnea CBS 473.64 TaxID=1395130 RepID=A0A6A6RQZ5_9PLEO|nr:hypothetical protein P280DRAFT_136980 [Massarina eburnea CBS 473.64]
MVLHDTDAPPDSFSDNPYPSADDPYANPSGAASFDASSLPHPIPIVGPLLGFSAGAVRFKTESTVKFAELRLKRQLTYEEAHALSEHLYRLEAKKSYYTAAAAGLGTWRWYTTMDTARFPLYQPKEIDVNKFLFVKGPMAQYARHSVRLFFYLFAAGELGKLFGQVSAQPVAAHDTANDPRLSQFSADLKAAVERTTGQGARGIAEQVHQQAEAAREASKSINGQPPRRPFNTQKPASTSADDMSPTMGAEPWSSSSESAWEDSSSASDTQSQPQPRQTPPSWGKRPSPQQSDDDASPTGGLFQNEVQSSSRPGESAWDRLRRGAAPPSQQRPPTGAPSQKPPRDGDSLGDSFTFAESDDERKKGQERAQREFDARIELERQGKDFSDEGKRW